MSIRNFWVEAKIDGRKTKLAGGPKAKDGGMVIRLYQRDNGKITTAVTITCREVNGRLITNVNTGKGTVDTIETER